MRNKRFIDSKILFLGMGTMLTFILLTSCDILKKQNRQQDFFTGTIVYNVEVLTNDLNTQDVKFKRDLLGYKMTLTVFENGDIQRVYDGSVNFGYEAEYINVIENTVLQKFKSNDSIYSRNASTENMVKISDVRLPQSIPVSVLDLKCETKAIGVQEIEPIDKKRTYLTLYYSYNETIKLDKTKYTKINDDLWAYFMDESNGAIFLKFEQDYATYKIVYTAIQIQKGVFPSEAENAPKLNFSK